MSGGRGPVWTEIERAPGAPNRRHAPTGCACRPNPMCRLAFAATGCRNLLSCPASLSWLQVGEVMFFAAASPARQAAAQAQVRPRAGCACRPRWRPVAAAWSRGGTKPLWPGDSPGQNPAECRARCNAHACTSQCRWQTLCRWRDMPAARGWRRPTRERCRITNSFMVTPGCKAAARSRARQMPGSARSSGCRTRLDLSR